MQHGGTLRSPHDRPRADATARRPRAHVLALVVVLLLVPWASGCLFPPAEHPDGESPGTPDPGSGSGPGTGTGPGEPEPPTVTERIIVLERSAGGTITHSSGVEAQNMVSGPQEHRFALEPRIVAMHITVELANVTPGVQGPDLDVYARLAAEDELGPFTIWRANDTAGDVTNPAQPDINERNRSVLESEIESTLELRVEAKNAVAQDYSVQVEYRIVVPESA